MQQNCPISMIHFHDIIELFSLILWLPEIRCDTFIVYGSRIDDDFSDDCTNPITRFLWKIEFFDIWDYLFVSLSLDFYNSMFENMFY